MRDIFPITLAAQHVTTTAALLDADLAKYYVSPGKREVMARQTVINVTGVASDVGSVVTKIQTGATTVDSDFSDVTGAAFASVADTDTTTSAGVTETIYFSLPNDRYVRAYATVAGTPILAVSVSLFVIKRNS